MKKIGKRGRALYWPCSCTDALGASAACPGHTFGTFSGMSACVNEQGELHICENNFPDEKFRNYISGLAGAEDGYFSGEECAAVTYVNVAYQGIHTLRGIELLYLDCSQISLEA